MHLLQRHCLALDEQQKPIRCFKSLQQIAIAIAVFALIHAQGKEAKAAVFAVGDVSPQQTFTGINIGGQLVDITAPDLPSGGGRITAEDGGGGTMDADLIVGGTGLFSGNITLGIGTTIGEVTINNPSGTLPLIAPNVTIGMFANGRGRINLNDFGTTLIVEDELIVAEEGEGELRLTNGSRVGVGIYNPDPAILRYENGQTFIGQDRDTNGDDQFLSEGLVTVDGFGSEFQTDELFVGIDGLGAMEVSGKARLLTMETTIGENAGSTGRVALTGQSTRWTNTGDLFVGLAGNALVEVNDSAVLVSDTIAVSRPSFLDLRGGTLISNTDISNGGVIRGYGRIESDLDINSTGELRNYGVTGVAAPEESLLITGTVANSGTIESLGGEMEFQSPVSNTREIIARDTTMHFRGGLVSTGSITLGGNTELHGGISLGGGSLLVLGDSESLIVGDLTFTASSVLGLTIGPDAGTLDVTGTASLANAIVALDYSAGVEPNVGDSYQIFQAGGGTTLPFNPTASAGGMDWMFSLVGNALYATAMGEAIPIIGADFNGDGTVNNLDLDIWENNFGFTGPAGSIDAFGDADSDGDVDGLDYFRIVRDLNGPPTPLVALAAATVPEPSTLALGLLVVLCCPRRPRR